MTLYSHPVLLGVDDSQALFATSSYVDPTYEAIESFSLSVPRLLLEYISGAKAFVSISLALKTSTANPLSTLQTNGSVMIAPSLLSTRKSPAMTRFLGTEKSTASSAYTPVGTSFDTYSEVLSGLNQLAVPPRLERKEAVGVVRMLQGWRGIRESEFALHPSPFCSPGHEDRLLTLGSQSFRIRPSSSAT